MNVVFICARQNVQILIPIKQKVNTQRYVLSLLSNYNNF